MDGPTGAAAAAAADATPWKDLSGSSVAAGPGFVVSLHPAKMAAMWEALASVSSSGFAAVSAFGGFFGGYGGFGLGE